MPLIRINIIFKEERRRENLDREVFYILVIGFPLIKSSGIECEDIIKQRVKKNSSEGCY